MVSDSATFKDFLLEDIKIRRGLTGVKVCRSNGRNRRSKSLQLITVSPGVVIGRGSGIEDVKSLF